MVWWRHRDLRPDDVFLGSYPRSGRNWLTFMVGEALTGQPVSFGEASLPIQAVEHHSRAVPTLPGDRSVLRTHEPYRTEYRESIYLVRHPADVLVSYFHYHERLGLQIRFRSFFDAFLSGGVDGYGRWDHHVDSWMDARPARMLRLRYEDLVMDTTTELQRVLRFLGVTLSEGRVRSIVVNNSLTRMKNKEAIRTDITPTIAQVRNPFVRKGEVGTWREILTETDLQRIHKGFEVTMDRAGYGPTP